MALTVSGKRMTIDGKVTLDDTDLHMDMKVKQQDHVKVEYVFVENGHRPDFYCLAGGR
jgi:hypothetical protein